MALEVTDATFEKEVLERSRTTPVLVDFWAEWCGPCRVLGPVLDAVEQAHDGAFVLAKIDTDANRNVSAAFQISSIPAVKLFVDGKVRGEFVGALPERQVNAFLKEYLPNEAAQALQELAARDPLAAADQVLTGAAGDPMASSAQEIIWKALPAALAGVETSLPDAVKKTRALAEALAAPGGPYSDAREALLAFLDRNGADAGGEGDSAPARLARLFQEGREREALDFFTGRIEAAPSAERGTLKDDLVTCFHLLGNQGPLVNEYRRKLSSLLF